MERVATLSPVDRPLWLAVLAGALVPMAVGLMILSGAFGFALFADPEGPVHAAATWSRITVALFFLSATIAVPTATAFALAIHIAERTAPRPREVWRNLALLIAAPVAACVALFVALAPAVLIFAFSALGASAAYAVRRA
jgi:heme/copper-type cytochrome/quinol oxidase subunit 2